MIYKYTKCESVIAKIMADADIEEGNIRVTDIKEWIFEAIEKIGAPMQYIQKESGVDGCPVLEIHDYQIPLPDDLQHLSTVAYSKGPTGPWKPARTNNASFREHMLHNHHHHHECCVCNTTDDAEEDTTTCSTTIAPKDPTGLNITSLSQLYSINGMKYLDRVQDHGDLTFFIKPGWIVLNRKQGFVKLAYKAIATDERGYPLIPDTTSYLEAVYWYVMMKLSFPKFLKGKLGGKGVNSAANVYNYIQLQWNFYRNQAYAEAMMPTESDMRSIKNEWNKLVPEWESDEMLFKPEGLKQINYTEYYYGY